ncbi:carotenoid oxygenase family protein [Falsiroseomonas oryzae]|uniref:carotenoid oxygenase family protein n=1 Tax=Falsiroseomonas oryzae TaxID=2766473 RepID=UPI0022EB66DE|nr:carotenoid oxygenase family protein [Roseomonas sp. MO-31]
MPDGTVFHRAGNFAPIHAEHDIAELKVSGALPRDLCGTLFRNGPNPQFDEAGVHWFFGDGMVHAFTLSDGRAAYRNRWVRTHKWRAEHAAGRPLLPCYPRPSLPGLAIRDTGVANTNVVWHAGRLLALEEGHLPFALDPATLETLGVETFGGVLRGRFTAHPKVDPATGEMLFFGYGIGGPRSARMAWGTIQPDGRVGKLERFGAPYCALVHDFAVTERHVLFPVMPLTGSRWRAITRGQPFAWEPELGGHVGLLRRAEGVASLRWFRAESCYVFHVLNAWDEGARVVADVMQYDAPPLFPHADGTLPDPARTRARLVRWTLDPEAGTESFATEVLDDAPGEFPRLDERRAGRRNRFGAYAVRRTGAPLFDAIVWRDMESGRARSFALPPGDALSEAVFVPRHASAPEGDGWLLTVAWRAAEGRSDLLVLDTDDITQGPVAAVHLPHRVPFGFHGNWVAGAA